MYFSDFKFSFQPTFLLKSIGKRQDIVPDHIIKWSYKTGMGKTPSPGETIFCNYGVSLLDGTQIISPNEYRVTNLLFGRGRLIEGLEIVLAGCRKGEVFKVKISSDYAYKDREDVQEIPPFSTLIFDITIIDIKKLNDDAYNIQELLSEVDFNIEKVDSELRKRNSKNAIDLLEEALSKSRRLKHYKSFLGQKIVVKIANILINQQKLDEALRILQKYEYIQEESFLKTKCKLKIYQLKGEQFKMFQQMIEKYQLHFNNQSIKKYIRKYFSKINVPEILNELDNFDLKVKRHLLFQKSKMISTQQMLEAQMHMN